MAYPIQITLGTANKVSVNYQSQEVSISVTYQLERGETDLLAIARDKASELVAAHRTVWAQVRGEIVKETNSPISPAEISAAEKIEASEIELPEIEISEVSEENGVPAQTPETLLSGGQLAAIEALLVQAGWTQSQTEDHLLDQFGKSELIELSAPQAAQWLLELQRASRLQTQTRSQERRAATIHLNGHP